MVIAVTRVPVSYTHLFYHLYDENCKVQNDIMRSVKFQLITVLFYVASLITHITFFLNYENSLVNPYLVLSVRLHLLICAYT